MGGGEGEGEEEEEEWPTEGEGESQQGAPHVRQVTFPQLEGLLPFT